MKHFLILLLLISLTAEAKDRPLYTLYTGPAKGTYHHVAQDMQKACSSQLEIQIETTPGTLANINSLITKSPFKAGHRLAFVQEDALDMMLGSEPKTESVYKKVSPMYNEEVMIIVNKRSGILGVGDLPGKKVSMGLPGSGNWFTANLLKKRLGVKWIVFETSPEESTIMVLTGQVDAAIIVGGAPLQLFQELGKTMSDRVAIIPLYSPLLDKIYQTARIPPKTYLWADYPVNTKSTRSLMIAARDVPDQAIKEFKSCLVKNLPAIQKFGHPKWREISQNLRK